jgi:hypothetical protein
MEGRGTIVEAVDEGERWWGRAHSAAIRAMGFKDMQCWLKRGALESTVKC